MSRLLLKGRKTMKRSEINSAIRWAADLMKSHHISLPVYADWSPAEWKEHEGETGLIRQLMLGWDITDYGRGDFDKIGTVLYTVRNGSDTDPDAGVPYCEKYLIMKECQRLLNHYHVSKTEDIINRAGGVMQIFLWNADPETGKLLDQAHLSRGGGNPDHPRQQHFADAVHGPYFRGKGRIRPADLRRSIQGQQRPDG